ncbi:MAG: hypothetical protein Q8O93_04705 [bacterium]|nr:hypothetical protein [bacterium]
MINPIDFFKKKQPKPNEPAEKKSPEPPADKKINLDNISIHSMPGRFRHQPVKQDSAKTTGLIIVIGGVVVLISASILLYYFLFKQPAVKLAPEPVEPAPNGQAAPVKPEPAGASADLNRGTLTMPEPEETEAATSTVEIATTTPEQVEANLEAVLKLGADSDNDGLTDSEEILLGTSTSTPDTDGDGFIDGAEIFNLYDPAGGGKLADNAGLSFYENKTFSYGLLYPSAWTVSTNGGDDSVMFRSPDNQFFQIVVQPNADGQALDDWYKDQLSVTEINEAGRASGAGWQGVKSSDGLTLYLTDVKRNFIFSLTYLSGGGDTLYYPNLFQAALKSFSLQ